MTKTKKTWDLISDGKRKSTIDEIIYFFKKEKDEDIGNIHAEELLDLILENAAIEIYNKGVEDSKRLVKEKIETLELDIDSLLKK